MMKIGDIVDRVENEGPLTKDDIKRETLSYGHTA